jgi:hypothetical protein
MPFDALLSRRTLLKSGGATGAALTSGGLT